MTKGNVALSSQGKTIRKEVKQRNNPCDQHIKSIVRHPQGIHNDARGVE